MNHILPVYQIDERRKERLKPVVIFGRTGCGKNTVMEELLKLGYTRIVEYTTRPKRDGETEDDYHFVTEEEYMKLSLNGKFAEDKSYNTIYGIWRYGALKSDFCEDKVAIMGPRQLMQIWERNIPVTSIFIDTPLECIYERTGKRGDNINEVKRRIEADDKVYEAIKDKATMIVDGTKSVEDILTYLRSHLGMKIWVDDVRNAPEGYLRCHSTNETIRAIEKFGTPWLIDFDHDAGDYASDGGDFIRIMDWMEMHGISTDVRIHSMNPVGRRRMEEIARKNGWRIIP